MGKPNAMEISRRQFLAGAGTGVALAVIGPLASVTSAESGKIPEPGVADWARFGYDLHNTRFNTHERQLGKDNVGRLKMKWEFNAGAPIQNCPAVIGDTLFFGTYAGEFFALDSSNGSVRWKFKVGDPLKGEPRFLRSSPTYENGRIYFGDGRTYMQCLEASTGKEVWKVLMDENPGFNQSQITCSPAVFRGKVYIGVTSARGQVACLDAETGKILWRFWTVPESKIGGGSVWSAPAIDEERGIVYNGTGNAKSFSPPGPMLYTESLIANDMDTAELLWFFQARPADFGPFNLDFASHPMIFDASHPSRPGAVRTCVGAGNKAGFYTLNRYTGEKYWKVMLTNHSNNGGPWMDSTAVAYNRVYVVSNSVAINKRRRSVSVTAGLNAYTGDIEWWVPNQAMVGAPPAVANSVFYQCLMDGSLSAWDADTGDPLWDYKLPSGGRGGIAIANGALYTSNGVPMRAEETPRYSMFSFTVDGK